MDVNSYFIEYTLFLRIEYWDIFLIGCMHYDRKCSKYEKTCSLLSYLVNEEEDQGNNDLDEKWIAKLKSHI